MCRCHPAGCLFWNIRNRPGTGPQNVVQLYSTIGCITEVPLLVATLKLVSTEATLSNVAINLCRYLSTNAFTSPSHERPPPLYMAMMSLQIGCGGLIREGIPYRARNARKSPMQWQIGSSGKSDRI